MLPLRPQDSAHFFEARLLQDAASPTELLRRLRRAGITAGIWEQHPRPAQRRLLPHVGRFSYVFIEPLSCRDSDVNPFERLSRVVAGPDELDALRRELFPGTQPAFLGGRLFALSYDSSRHLEHIRGMQSHPRQPELLLQEVSCLIICDRVLERNVLLDWQGSLAAPVCKILEEKTPLTALSSASKPKTDSFTLQRSRDEFIEIVECAKEYIRAGDIFQVVLSNTFRRPQTSDPLELYARLSCENPSPYQFLIPGPGYTLVGASPEMMLFLEPAGSAQRRLAMRLVAGTYPHAPDGGIPDLRADPKEHAEHVMLVDHIRNDIGRVAQIGSVRVDDLCTTESYRDVHHLVSQVSGCVASDLNPVEALRACFPIATLTGTPKIRAMEIIAELEGAARGFFGGAVLLQGYDGFMEGAVVIRSACVYEEEIEISAGAGIVYDSVAEREFEECRWKAQALLALA